MPKAVEAMKNRFSSARAALPYTGAAAPMTAMYTVTLANRQKALSKTKGRNISGDLLSYFFAFLHLVEGEKQQGRTVKNFTAITKNHVMGAGFP